MVAIDELVRTVVGVSRKRVRKPHVGGAVCVRAGNFNNERIYPTRWRCRFSLRDGIARTYPRVEAQVRTHQDRRSFPTVLTA